jgi:hypothetical protein
MEAFQYEHDVLKFGGLLYLNAFLMIINVISKTYIMIFSWLEYTSLDYYDDNLLC